MLTGWSQTFQVNFDEEKKLRLASKIGHMNDSIIGNDVNNGDEIAEYLPSFHFVIREDGTLEQELGVTDR